MSHVLILSSDKKMPEFHSDEGISIIKSYGRECQEIDRLVKKAYFYEMNISATKLVLSEFKKYLTENTESGSEVELWSIRLGGDLTKHYLSMPRTSNIPSKDLKEIEDLIDLYSEENFSPKIKKMRISELSINDILFLESHTGVCLIVWR